MTINETIKHLKENEAFNEAIIDVNERRRLLCVMWADGPENPIAVEVLNSLGFEKVRDHYRKVWLQESAPATTTEEIKANCQPPRGLSFEDWIING